jgi:NADH-quinone oxidoreductase subunit K
MVFELAFLGFSSAIIAFALWGILFFNENPIRFLIALELFLIAVSLRALIYSSLLSDLDGQLIAISVLVVAGSEAAIALAIIVLFTRVYPQKILRLSKLSTLKS